MPWRDMVKAIVETWYPGQAGGQAIAEILTGSVNPSGRLPAFQVSLAQTPRQQLEGLGTPWSPADRFDQGTPTTILYDEDAEVGYRWFVKTGAKPPYAFGHGLSYTRFAYSDLKVSGGDTASATFTVTKTGERAGADVPQLYLTEATGDKRMRLLGFERVELQPGESRRVTVTAEPRLIARFDTDAGQWRIAGGTHQIAPGKTADDLVMTVEAPMIER
jgi:beta-glucosidase